MHCPRPTTFRRAPLSLAISLLSLPSLASAQSTIAEDTDVLPVVEVTAERLSDGEVVIRDGQLERFQANSLSDIFSSQPDIDVGGSGIGEKVYVRGIEDTMLNVSIDGATQAGTLFHHSGRIAIDPALLEQVEVDAGAGRATAGAGALGGSVRFVTRDPGDLLREGERFGALVNVGGFSNTEGYRASTTVFGRGGDHLSGLASISKRDENAYEDGHGDEVLGTDETIENGLFKIVGEFDHQQTLKLSHEIRKDEGERPQRPQWVVSDFNRLYELDGERKTTTLNYGMAPLSAPWLDLDVTVYHTESDIEQNVDDRWGRYAGDSRSVGGDIRNTSHVGNHTLIYGFDYRRDRVNAGYDEDPRQEEERGTVRGVYLQDDMQVTDRLLLSAGLRYDEYQLVDNGDQYFEDEDVSPNINLSYQALEGLTLRAGYAEAFRGPAPHDTFKLERASNAEDLTGEKARNTEIGFDLEHGAWWFSGEVYRSTIEDVIGDQLFGPTIYENVGDLESDGFRLDARYRAQSWEAGLAYHHNDATVDGDSLTVYEHNLLGNSMGDTWVAEASYRVNDSLELGWQGRFVERLDNLKTSVGSIDKPGYGVHDVYLHWLPTGDEDLRLSLAVNNLTDHQYLDHASNADYQHLEDYEGIVGKAAPGRDIRLGMLMRF